MVSGFMMILPEACASRRVGGFPDTSTMRTMPLSSMWVNSMQNRF
jgi:hypothetical protein